MASLKELRGRINSVKSTQKITSAMKMVAAAKLRRAQERAEAGRPYAERMGRMLESLAAVYEDREDVPALLGGTGKDETRLFLVVTSDRGLCGGFNSSIVRQVKRRVTAERNEGKAVKLLIVGRKGRDQLKRDHGDLIIDTIDDVGRPQPRFAEGAEIAQRIARMFADGEFDVCSVFYNKFKSAISQVVTEAQLIPMPVGAEGEERAEAAGPRPTYEYEPREEEMLPELLERNLAVQIYSALLESSASEQGARMSAMDNATRNASDMIEKLTMHYNRTRQATITKELIEIISGAEAL